MSLVEFKRKKNPKNKIIIGISAFVLLLIIFSLTRTIFGIGYRTTNANPSTIFDRTDVTGLVIKSEKVYNSTSTGKIEYIEEEGAKVPVGREIMNVTTTNEEISEQLNSIEKQIEELGINYYSEGDNPNLLEDIQKKINEGNFNDINDFLEEKDMIDDNDNLVSENLEALLVKRNELNELLDGANITSLSKDSGILSYKIDGYEEILKTQGFENYIYKALDFDEISKNINNTSNNDETTGGSPLFKIIDDYIWYIALKFEDEEVLEFEEGQVYNIQLSDSETLKGRIVAINLDGSKGVIVVEFKDKLHDFYNDRIIDVSIIKSETNSYEIPTRSIIEKDGQTGVYINHIYGIVKFVPVKTLYDYDDITYVERGNNEAYINIEGEEVRTITQFDEIFLNPSNLEENQIFK